MKGHTSYIWINIRTEGNAYEMAYIRRDIHMEEYIYGGDRHYRHYLTTSQ